MLPENLWPHKWFRRQNCEDDRDEECSICRLASAPQPDGPAINTGLQAGYLFSALKALFMPARRGENLVS
jgi:hypothetical protein